uniref:Uncharacterized protein n=2 Tax=Octopus bimaculoides TaxID=37653 RepID=A0A0L8HFY8_OCTBM
MKDSCPHQFEKTCNYPHWIFKAIPQQEYLCRILKNDSKCFYDTTHDCAKFYDNYLLKACASQNGGTAQKKGMTELLLSIAASSYLMRYL